MPREYLLDIGHWRMDVRGRVEQRTGTGFVNHCHVNKGSGLSLDFTVFFSRGPRLHLGTTIITARGRRTTVVHDFITESFRPGAEIFLWDLAFSPLVRGGSWGSLSVDAGARYGVSTMGSGRNLTALMGCLGGRLDLHLDNIARDVLFWETEMSGGLGRKSWFFQLDTGLRIRASNVVHARIGLRFLKLRAGDRLEITSAAGPTFEIGFFF